MFGNVYGLDLGTYEIKVYDKKKNSIWKEKNAIAITNKKEIFSVGDDAYAMFEKAPQNIEIQFPMKEGVISHFYNMQYLLQNLIKKEQHFVRGSKYIIAVPTDVTEVEKRAFYDLVVHSNAKAKEVRIVERGIADAIGFGLDVKNLPGVLTVNMGAETTEITILSYGGVVLNKLLKIGSITYDQAIKNTVRYKHEFLIGHLSAEELRKEYGVSSEVENEDFKVAGRNLITRIPEQKHISKEDVQEAMRESLQICLHEILSLLERTPPEVQRMITKNGIYVSGGFANLRGLKTYMEDKLEIPVHIAEQPEFCAVTGLKNIIESKDLMKMTYSMLDENYRWMR